MDEYDDDKQNGFLIKAVAGSECKQNEDYIKNNEELITLLKLKTKQVTEENQKLMDRRGRYNWDKTTKYSNSNMTYITLGNNWGSKLTHNSLLSIYYIHTLTNKFYRPRATGGFIEKFKLIDN